MMANLKHATLDEAGSWAIEMAVVAAGRNVNERRSPRRRPLGGVLASHQRPTRLAQTNLARNEVQAPVVPPQLPKLMLNERHAPAGVDSACG